MAYNGAGIYGIYNVVDNKIYIGKSENIARRLAAHRSCFNKNQGYSYMYQEPIEKFVFCVILKLSDVEYKRYGDFFESIFIIQARDEHHMGLYNSSKEHDQALWTVLGFFGVLDNMRFSIREALGGVELGTLRNMKKESRERIIQKVNGQGGEQIVEKNWGR